MPAHTMPSTTHTLSGEHVDEGEENSYTYFKLMQDQDSSSSTTFPAPEASSLMPYLAHVLSFFNHLKLPRPSAQNLNHCLWVMVDGTGAMGGDARFDAAVEDDGKVGLSDMLAVAAVANGLNVVLFPCVPSHPGYHHNINGLAWLHEEKTRLQSSFPLKVQGADSVFCTLTPTERRLYTKIGCWNNAFYSILAKGNPGFIVKENPAVVLDGDKGLRQHEQNLAHSEVKDVNISEWARASEDCPVTRGVYNGPASIKKSTKDEYSYVLTHVSVGAAESDIKDGGAVRGKEGVAMSRYDTQFGIHFRIQKHSHAYELNNFKGFVGKPNVKFVWFSPSDLGLIAIEEISPGEHLFLDYGGEYDFPTFSNGAASSSKGAAANEAEDAESTAAKGAEAKEAESAAALPSKGPIQAKTGQTHTHTHTRLHTRS
jgi:hypothetical protein